MMPLTSHTLETFLGRGMAIRQDGFLIAEVFIDPDTGKPFVFVYGPQTVVRDYTGQVKEAGN